MSHRFRSTALLSVLALLATLRWLRVAGGPAVVDEHAVGQLMDAARLPR